MSSYIDSQVVQTYEVVTTDDNQAPPREHRRISSCTSSSGNSTSSSSSSSSSSWSPKERTQVQRSPSQQLYRHFSFDERNRGERSETAMEAIVDLVPADQERQLLLLMLLAQVCALHDPTPRTFTVHVLELFERGILDRESIHFLFELGLVPKASSSTLPSAMRLPQSSTAGDDITSQVLATTISNNVGNANISLPPRSREVLAIRQSLEQRDQQQRQSKAAATAAASSSPLKERRQASWSVAEHPLSLSRFQREFVQAELLASGGFGQVFRATSKMDGRDYAIKRVIFAAEGYSQESVKQVIREVQCLAVCDHPHVVRYYTSWLEPSWMTGSDKSNGTRDCQNSQKLLTGLHKIVSGESDSESVLKDYFKDPMWNESNRRRRFSVGSSYDATEGGMKNSLEECSEWTIQEENSIDDSYIGQQHSWSRRDHIKTNQGKYIYQICLFVQMQLCHPTTLADWIYERNRSQEMADSDTKGQTAAIIFGQIVAGLRHVHHKGIIHRDLKPANIFASIDDGIQFKIGDFGLSKLIESVSHADSPRHNLSRRNSSSLTYFDTSPEQPSRGNLLWQEPLTAGVGTASYASPEQVSSRSYSTEADIFSLGLILLELLSCFSTEHERIKAFQDCRHLRILPDELSRYYPAAAKIVLACTEADPKKRPTAQDLIGINIYDQTLHSPCDLSDRFLTRSFPEKDRAIRSLEQRLIEQEKAIEECQTKLAEKDRIIEELRHKLRTAQ